MPRTRMIRLALLAALVLALASPADAGWLRCHRRSARRCQPAPACQTPRYGPPATAALSPATAALSPAAGDSPTPQAGSQALAYAPVAGSFLEWLNATRQARGLRPVGWDAGLAADAARNSAIGFGHFTGGPGQCAGWGDLASVCSAWLASPAHAASLLNPSISRVGLAGSGPNWTFNAN